MASCVNGARALPLTSRCRKLCSCTCATAPRSCLSHLSTQVASNGLDVSAFFEMREARLPPASYLGRRAWKRVTGALSKHSFVTSSPREDTERASELVRADVGDDVRVAELLQRGHLPRHQGQGPLRRLPCCGLALRVGAPVGRVDAHALAHHAATAVGIAQQHLCTALDGRGVCMCVRTDVSLAAARAPLLLATRCPAPGQAGTPCTRATCAGRR